MRNDGVSNVGNIFIVRNPTTSVQASALHRTPQLHHDIAL